MTITKNAEGNKLSLILEGRLDTLTAPDLDTVITEELADVTELVIDMKDLAYVSSAGLRILLKAQKTMNVQGSMCIKNVNKAIKEVFDVTGFSSILKIID